MAIVLGFFALLVALFIIYSSITTDNYRQLRIDEVSKTVEYASARVNAAIAETERNAIDLALEGTRYYEFGDGREKFGEAVAVENFEAFRNAVGGGIWFEPYVFGQDTLRQCFYAFYDASIDAVRFDPEFESEAYDYHTQSWYTEIAAGLSEKYETVWTAPYNDALGAHSLMTTVGAGIYDDDGRFIGMSTVDWQIKGMVNSLSAIKPTASSFVLIASPRDDYIITGTFDSESMSTGAPLSDLPWFEELHFTEDDGVDIGSFTEGGIEYLSFAYLLDNEWLFSVQIPQAEIFAEIETRNTQFLIIIGISAFILLAGAFVLVSRLINRPLRKLTSGVSELGGGDLDKQIEIHSKDEIGTLAAAFNKMTVDLKESIEQSARERAEKERIGAELSVATHIQASMLPRIFPPFPDRPELDIYAGMLPAKEVGGDFYDFFLVDKNTLAVVIADVSGKGVPAALFMVITKTIIKNNAQNGKSPGEVFETVNNILCEGNDADMFVTAFMGYLDIPSGRFTFVNAGHNPPLINAGGHFDWLKTEPGFVLAGLEGITYRQGEVTFKPGDELFLYTDGVTEAVNNEKELFSEARLLESANNYSDLPLKEFILAIKREIDSFADGAEQADDITMLALRYSGQREGEGMKMHVLEIEARIENLEAVQGFISEHIEGCAPKIHNQIMMAVDEVFSNIAGYAYYPETGGAVVRVSDGSEITIEFEDGGVAYDPLSAEDPDTALSLDEREVGGLGIFLVKNIMDSVTYQRAGDKNLLTITKKK